MHKALADTARSLRHDARHNPFRRLPDRTVSIKNRLDCKTRKTKQEEQNAMKKIQINRAKGHAKNGKGFYIALACGLLAVGAAAWFGVTAAMRKLEVNPPEVSTPEISNQETDLKLPADTPITLPSEEVSEPEESTAPTTAQPDAPAKSTAFAMPVSGDVVNAYSGEKMVKSKTLGDWVMHTGTDLAASAKTPVKAVSAGTVSAVETDDLWGCTVTIEHANGVISYYANLGDDIRVTAGQSVKLGDVIGTVVETADIERAEESHLHLGIKQDGEWVDPVAFIESKK